MIFIRIVTFSVKGFLYIYIFLGMLFNVIICSMKGGYGGIFRFVSILFNKILNVIIF